MTSVTLSTRGHPLDPQQRKRGKQGEDVGARRPNWRCRPVAASENHQRVRGRVWEAAGRTLWPLQVLPFPSHPQTPDPSSHLDGILRERRRSFIRALPGRTAALYGPEQQISETSVVLEDKRRRPHRPHLSLPHLLALRLQLLLLAERPSDAFSTATTTDTTRPAPSQEPRRSRQRSTRRVLAQNLDRNRTEQLQGCRGALAGGKEDRQRAQGRGGLPRVQKGGEVSPVSSALLKDTGRERDGARWTTPTWRVCCGRRR